MTAQVTVCHPETATVANNKERISTMKDKFSRPLSTLADLDSAVKDLGGLSEVRRRDLRSAIARVSALLGQPPAQISFELPVISKELAKVNPVASGMSAKTLANVRANFLAAVKVAGAAKSARAAAFKPSAEWSEFLAKLPDRRSQIGLSRVARYGSMAELAPRDINDQVIANYIASVRAGSLHRNPNHLHRVTAKIWNEITLRLPELGLQQVVVPSLRAPPQRADWSSMPASFRKDVAAYLEWCGGEDVFSDDARIKPLSARTIDLRRDQIHAAVTALLGSGVAPEFIKSLADLVTPDAFRAILRQRHAAAGGAANSFNSYLAKALISIAREWGKSSYKVIADLKKMMSQQPKLPSGLTDKNKRFLRQFDDPAAFVRLAKLPPLLWAEVKREPKPNFRTLAKAQAALGIATLLYMPIRLQNLASLTFDTHIFLNDGAGAISSLELPASEVKNGMDMAFDIPPALAKMMMEYRDKIAPKVVGHRPKRLFVNVDGRPKAQETVAWLICTNAFRRAGLVLTVHQFRHLAARVLLDAEPGSYELVKQDLGHKSLKTTINFYAGTNTRRAANHHQRLIDIALENQKPTIKRRRQHLPLQKATGATQPKAPKQKKSAEH